MTKRAHIAKLLILLTTILLLAGTRYAHAQNTSAFPYLDSWHQYSVIPMGDAGNTYEWIIYSNEAEANNGASPDDNDSYELIESLSWVDNRVVSDGNAYIEILFDDAVFSDGETWYLVYAEYSDNSCIARRKFDITIADNTFYVELPTNDDDCNTMTGSVWDNGDGDISDLDKITTVPFTVTMNKDENFTITSWEFTGSLSLTSGSSFNSIHSTPFLVDNGQTNSELYDWEITGNAASFTLTVTVDDEGQFDTDNVTFEVQIIGDITSDYALQLTIDPLTVKAESGESYTVETGDNGTGNKTQGRTRWGIPNTSIVSVSP